MGKDSSSSFSFLIFADCPYPPDVCPSLDFLKVSGRKRKLDYLKFNVEKKMKIDIDVTLFFNMCFRYYAVGWIEIFN